MSQNVQKSGQKNWKKYFLILKKKNYKIFKVKLNFSGQIAPFYPIKCTSIEKLKLSDIKKKLFQTFHRFYSIKKVENAGESLIKEQNDISNNLF